jgi:hypothetical protein
MKRKSRRELVLDIYDREAMGEVTAREIALINQALVEEFGEGGAMDPGEITRILVDEDLPVRFEQVFRMSTRAEKYESVFKHLPQLDTLEQAAASIREIDTLYRKFQRCDDRTGIRFARQTAQRGKQDAEQAAREETQDARYRTEQAEIAQWFTIWLQTPDLFEQWLQLRQATADYRNKFSTTDSRDVRS